MNDYTDYADVRIGEFGTDVKRVRAIKFVVNEIPFWLHKRINARQGYSITDIKTGMHCADGLTVFSAVDHLIDRFNKASKKCDGDWLKLLEQGRKRWGKILEENEIKSKVEEINEKVGK